LLAPPPPPVKAFQMLETEGRKTLLEKEIEEREGVRFVGLQVTETGNVN